MKPIHTILHATDFSSSAGDALAVAASLAHGKKATLIVLHVVPAAPRGPAEMQLGEKAGAIVRDVQAYKEEMRRKLQQIKAPASNLAVEHVIDEGDVAGSILRHAERTPCDIIVLGAHGVPGKTGLGSVAHTVLERAACPVIVVQAPPG
jgi:nucleotide-binding universal stress UspA family protein